MPGGPLGFRRLIRVGILHLQYVDQFVVVFIDDILMNSKDREDHDTHLQVVLETLSKEQLYVKMNK